MRISSVILILSLCCIGCQAAFKDPAWKHCMHPLHALPKEWGRITSPGFPNGINTQIQCSWIISSNPGYRVKLAFQTLNMTGSIKSCFTQFVEVLDYKAGSSMGKFCGTRRPGDFVSYGTRLRFDLQGDTSGAKTKGFEVRFKATKEPGGFKSTWSFPGRKPTSPPKRRKKPKAPAAGRPNSRPAAARPGSGPRRPEPGPGRRGPPAGLTPRRPPGTEAPEPTVEASGPLPSKQPAPVKTRPPRIQPRPPQNNRIPFQPPPARKSAGPVIYGPKAGVRGVDHGSSSVITTVDKDENKLNIYVIVGIAAGGVVAIILIVVIMKFCVFDKSRKKRKRRLELERQNSQKTEHESYHMTTFPGSVPEHYMSEQIVPERMQSYHHLQSLPMVPSMHQHYPPPYAHSVKSGKSRTTPPMMIQGMPYDTRSVRSRPRSSKSRARSTRSRAKSLGRDASSRRSEIRRSKSRNSVRSSSSRRSMRRSKSRNSLRREQSRSLQHIPPVEGQWIMIDQRHPAEMTNIQPYPPTSDVESTSSSSSSSAEFDSDSSDSYERRKRVRSKTRRRNSVPRRKSHPPPYDSLMQNTVPYYVINKARDFDEGYNTGKKSTGAKSSSSNKKKSRKMTKSKTMERSKGKKIKRKHSY